MSANACPSCGRSHDRASSLTDGSPIGSASPSAGDVSVCIACGSVAIYIGVGVQVRRPTAQELAALEQDAEVARIQAAVRSAPGPR